MSGLAFPRHAGQHFVIGFSCEHHPSLAGCVKNRIFLSRGMAEQPGLLSRCVKSRGLRCWVRMERQARPTGFPSSPISSFIRVL